MNDFAEILKVLLKRKGISQRRFEEMTGISETTISRYVKGKLEPSMKTLIIIAKALDVSIDCLVGNDANNDPRIEEYEDQIHILEEQINQLRLAIKELRLGKGKKNEKGE